MKKFTNHLTALTLAGLMVLTTASVGAASVYRSVTAKQNTTATVKVNGVNLTLKEDDDTLYPLTYDGVTYLPAKQLADALGYNASVNDGSVTITSKTSSTTTSSSGDIGAEKAKQIALEHAGLSASKVSFIKTEADYDDGRKGYDIEFYSGNKEYDYEILASNGTIVSVDYDVENYPIPSTTTSNNYIGVEAAKQAALKHAGLSESQVSFKKAKLDYDDGRAEYELEFRHNFQEYEYTIDAVSGTILDFERD